MKHYYHHWHSPILGRDIGFDQWGHSGAPILVFPTSGGSNREAYDFGIVHALRPWIERGAVQLFCLDSIDRQSWYAYHLHPGRRAHHHALYDRYVRDEVVPLVHHLNPNHFLSTFGCSFGAYHAMNFGLRHPGTISRIFAFSGLYRIDGFVDGYWDDNCYFHSPMAYMAHMGESDLLRAIRQQRIILTTTKHNEVPGLGHGTFEMARTLRAKGVPVLYSVWEHGHHRHDWPTWQEMAQTYV